METPNESDDAPWWDELIGGLTNKQSQMPPPPTPQPPPVDQSAWGKSVEQARVSDSLGSVHDLGLIIFNETRSYTDRPDSSEPLDIAREKIGHSIINADQKYGFNRMGNAKTALPIEPSANALNDPATRAAFDSSMKAAREAYLSGTDPTYGAVHFNARGDPGRYNWRPKGMNPPGKPLKAQSGPYNNSYTKGDTPYSAAWLNTYEP
jgi:hypothetical protein